METEGAISSEVEKEIVNPDKNVSAITPGKNVPKAVENSVDTSARKTSDALCSKDTEEETDQVEKEIVNPDKNVSANTPGKNVPKAVENSVDTSARKTSDALCSKDTEEETDKRSRKPTTKGKSYQKEELLKRRKSVHNRLTRQFTLITQCIESGCVDMVNMETANMDRMFDELKDLNMKYLHLLEEESEQEECHEWINNVDESVFDLKTKVCTWLKEQDNSSMKSDKSSRSSRRSGRSSEKSHRSSRKSAKSNKIQRLPEK